MSIDASTQFSNKAHGYQQHRWDYAPAAMDLLVAKAGLSSDSVIADIGSGTGMVSRHLVERVKCLYAIEPSLEMRQIAEQELANHPAFHSRAGLADTTGLPDASLDLIAVGRAIHWFPAESSRREFLRILKTAGWLAILRTPTTPSPLLEAITAIRTAENGCNLALDKRRIDRTPLDFYFGGADYFSWSFPTQVQETWPELLGRISSFSSTPDENHPRYGRFWAALRTIFERYCVDGAVTIDYATELFLGRMAQETTGERTN